MLQGLETIVASRFGFAHHQKTIICDQEVDGRRWLTAFMGVLPALMPADSWPESIGAGHNCCVLLHSLSGRQQPLGAAICGVGHGHVQQQQWGHAAFSCCHDKTSAAMQVFILSLCRCRGHRLCLSVL